MRIRPIQLYVAAVCLAGVVGLTVLDWGPFVSLGKASVVGFTALTLLGILSESMALTIRLGGSAGNSSITFLPLLACAIVFGPPAAVTFIVATGVVAELFIRKKEPLRAAFNLGQLVLATTLAGIAFAAYGGVPQAARSQMGLPFELQILPFALFGLTFLASNHALVSVAISVHQGLPIRTVLVRMVGSSGTNVLYDLLISPIAIALAFLYVELGVPGLLLVLLPLLFIRHSYLINYKLQRANQDLLRALVKAIETRDPYTSGHSMRVAALARGIATELGLANARVDAVETAALLHDIGKIDAIYTEILRKDGGLSADEREIIESHVTKGVELLSSLSSFPKEILQAVRHHHERVDGKGYPDGLTGEAIPLAARIIKVCDAVDAMLSDRPYRQALSPSEVRREL
ncbi:MAG: HD-GYP domain-containing protein, partial [Gemmatimonadota bacterium]|nr:HD-GYP domain-containing protein [Gemmatimonadota bacterium]